MSRIDGTRPTQDFQQPTTNHTSTQAQPTYSPSATEDHARDAMLRNLVAYIAPTATPDAARDLRIQLQLDATRAAAAGPYLVSGVAVAASPQFRMVTGWNQIASDAHRSTKDVDQNIFSVLSRAKLDSSYAIVCSGRGTPAQVVKVTQALIDQGHLPRGSEPAETRIRAMQWEWGIGMDCAGFVQQSLLALPGASRESLGLKRADLEDFSTIATNKAFTRTTPETSRPGDIVALDDPGDVGHRAIVHTNRAIDPARADALKKQMGKECAAFLGGAGPFREIVVDSCWSAASNGSWSGGVRQETWLYDASSKTWGCFRPVDPDRPGEWKLKVSADPCDEKLIGIFRPKLSV
jgi:hypothetical protein